LALQLGKCKTKKNVISVGNKLDSKNISAPPITHSNGQPPSKNIKGKIPEIIIHKF
jgi:hypothetical protein